MMLDQLLEQNHSQCDYGGRDHNEFVPLQRMLRVTPRRLSSDVCHRSVPLMSRLMVSAIREYDAGVWDGEFIDSPVFVSP